MRFLYRGVHAKHPEKAAAMNGVVVPGDVNGTVSPEQHNRGGWSASSPYTSWTYNEALARSYACSEKGRGVLLRTTDDAPTSSRKWRWVPSPEHYDEQETLLFGVRIDIEVIERELACRGEGEAEESTLSTSRSRPRSH